MARAHAIISKLCHTYACFSVIVISQLCHIYMPFFETFLLHGRPGVVSKAMCVCVNVCVCVCVYL